MRHIYTGFTKDANGMIIQDATVSVYLAGTSTAASIYTTATSATAVNSVDSDDNGQFTFYVDSMDYELEQAYKLVIDKSVSTTASYGPVTIEYIKVDTPVVSSIASGGGRVITLEMGDGTSDDSARILSAITSASGGKLVFTAGTYCTSSMISPTLTGNTKWVCNGPVTIKAITNKIHYIIQLEVDSYELTIEGPLTFDCNSLARKGLRVNNDVGITTMAEATNLYMTGVKAINAYTDLNAYGAGGIHAYGAFNLVKFTRCGATNISRAAILTGTCDNWGINVTHGGINKYARTVIIDDPYIDGIITEDAVGSAEYIDMDGIKVLGPRADANGNVRLNTSLVIRGGTLINCTGRSVKSQMENNLIDGPTFERNASGIQSIASSAEVDFQWGCGVLTNYKIRYSLLTAGSASCFNTSSWAICTATARGYDTDSEGVLEVSGGDIVNNVPTATARMAYFVAAVSSGGGTFKNIVVDNNVSTGSGGYSTGINFLGSKTSNVKANGNVFNDLQYELVYSTDAAPTCNVNANGNFRSGTATYGVATSNISNVSGSGNYGFVAAPTASHDYTNPPTGTIEDLVRASATYTATAALSLNGRTTNIYPIVNAGDTNSSSVIAESVNVLRNALLDDSEDDGTLGSLYGKRIQFGHYDTNGSADPQTSLVYGLQLVPYLLKGDITTLVALHGPADGSNMTGGSVTNRYFILQENAADNRLANIYPAADNTYYLGKNDDDSPAAWKGLIVKDTTNGKYYRVEVISGVVTATDLTD